MKKKYFLLLVLSFGTLAIVILLIPQFVKQKNYIERAQKKYEEIEQTPLQNPTVDTIPLNKKVYLLIYNPKINDQYTNEYFGWNDPEEITNEVIAFFKNVSEGYLNYEIVQKKVVEEFPAKEDGFVYTFENYIECVNSNGEKCHDPDIADYVKILDANNICEMLNNDEIDELWLWGGPWFGYWESNLAGRYSFWYNSNPTHFNTCKTPLPIMGFNYERTKNEAIHNFGHRAESTLKRVFQSWDAENTHGWNRFALLSRNNNGQGGCGNTHITVNGTEDYIYTNKDNVMSNCEEFKDYPNIENTYKMVNCNDWGCDEFEYYTYWWNNIPRNTGINKDAFTGQEVLNNWWKYIFDLSWTYNKTTTY
ncbi:MAG: hypothetical protein ACOZAO_05030 [Patescibacteria group bacterium]